MTTKPCPYKFDGIQCRVEFGHEGDHDAVVQSRTTSYPVGWEYPDHLRERDLRLGFVPCAARHPKSVDIEGVWDTNADCEREIEHEGAHEADFRRTYDSPVEHLHWEEGTGWGDPEDEEDAPASSREVPVGVMAERSRRADMETYLISFRSGEQVQRLEVIAVECNGDSLLLRTPDDDILYPAGSWGPVRMEPTQWQ